MTRALCWMLLCSAPLALSACGDAAANPTPLAAAEGPSATTPDPDATRVEVVVLKPSDASLQLQLPGEVVGSEDAFLAAALGGFVESVRVDEGQSVSKGDTLVVVDRATRAAQYAQAEAQLIQAQSDLSRQEQLGDLATAAVLQQLRTGVAVAQAGQDLARTQLSRATVRAPFSGVVGEVAIEVGEVAGPGAPVVRLVQLDPVKVRLSVSDRDVVALASGMSARVTTAANGRAVQGTITHVAPVADLNTRTFLVDVAVPNPDRSLLPGMIAQVVVDKSLAQDAVIIPQDWIVTRLNDYGLYVDDGGVARWREVVLGDVVRGQIVVTEGLAPGDRVIVTGQHNLADGDALLLSREGTCCTAGRPSF